MFAVVLVLGIGAWANRDWLLLSAADLWIVSDPIGPADVVAVFGGGIQDRPLAAAQYYQRGLVKKILVADADQSPTGKSGAAISDVSVTKGILSKFGCPLMQSKSSAMPSRTRIRR